jgi:hypothetical protein
MREASDYSTIGSGLLLGCFHYALAELAKGLGVALDVDGACFSGGFAVPGPAEDG